MKSGFEKPDQQLVPIEVTFHPEELELGGSADASTNICLSWELASTEGQDTGKGTGTQPPNFHQGESVTGGQLGMMLTTAPRKCQ